MLKFSIFFLILFFSQISYSQTPEQLLEKTKLNYTAEKIFIHYDKQSYIAGDTIWFKAYILDGFLPSRKSTVLNVEMLSDSGKVIGRKILPISASMAANAFELPSNLQQGSYTITAFTGLMMNFGTSNYYNKQINIYNPANLKTAIDATFNPEVKFFAESGNLVANLDNTVAFKCVDNNGLPLNVAGKIINATGQEKAQFKSTHDGMGKFNFTPILGEKYFAECLIDASTKKTVALPAITLNASLMKLTFSEGKSYLEINNTNVSDNTKKPAFVLGVEENMIAFKIQLNENELVTKVELPTADLPSGILKITLFSKENQPLAERLAFINTDDYEVKTKLETNTLGTTARAKNNFTFLVDDTTVGSYSVAVINAELEIENIEGEDNIISRFLLTDNLRGKINNPAYYFENNDEVHAKNLDLVMLTNGWRRYSWTEILTNKFPEMVYKDPNYITLFGSAFAPYTTNPLKEASLLFFVKTNDSIPDIINKATNAVGDFEIPGMLFEDSATFFIQNSNARDKRINLKLKSPSLSNLFSINKKNIPYYNFIKPNSNQFTQIAKMVNVKNTEIKNVQLLESIQLTTKAKTAMQQYEKKYVKGLLGSSSARTLDFLTDPPRSGVNILDYLKARLTGVTITGGPVNYNINYRNTSSLTGGQIPMAIFLDEYPVDVSMVATMPADDFAIVKVFSNGPLAGVGGALALYTNKDKKGKSSAYSSFSEAIIEGFAITKEFYSPNYDVSFTNNNTLNDNRTTIYWNPYLVNNKDYKQINFSFYNSDYAKKFKIVLEGLTKDGRLVHFEKIVE